MNSAYQQTLDYIYSFLDFEKSGLADQALHWDLRRMTALLERLGNPHLAAKTIHIAGTKGKGSVAVMAASALAASGYKTGLYTSPHLISYNERIRIGNTLISDADLVILVEKLKPDIAAVNREAKYGMLTTFEVTTAAAFEYFRANSVDFQVIETGLGGRLDATNVVDPEVAVITAISLDHTQILGDTLEKIAGEKAGIVKPGKPVVSSPQAAEVEDVLESTCRKNHSPLVKVGQDVTWDFIGTKGSKQMLRVHGRLASYDLTIPLLGRHQLENASVAVAALEILKEKGCAVTERSIKRGLAKVEWPGRLQILGRRPFLIADGAHNGESAARLVRALREYFKFDKAILIIGVSADKDLSGIVTELKPMFEQVIATQSVHPRAMLTATLVDEMKQHGVSAMPANDISAAIMLARKLAGPKDLICVTGSLFVAGGAIEHCRHGAINERLQER